MAAFSVKTPQYLEDIGGVFLKNATKGQCVLAAFFKKTLLKVLDFCQRLSSKRRGSSWLLPPFSRRNVAIFPDAGFTGVFLSATMTFSGALKRRYMSSKTPPKP
ncbi:hypothetical protein GQ457_03G024510 [Hibiscus cannabinus]